jgi:hypothetical protein
VLAASLCRDKALYAWERDSLLNLDVDGMIILEYIEKYDAKGFILLQ